MSDRLSWLLANDKKEKADKWDKIKPQLTSEFRKLGKKTPPPSAVDKSKETNSESIKPRLIKKS